MQSNKARLKVHLLSRNNDSMESIHIQVCLQVQVWMTDALMTLYSQQDPDWRIELNEHNLFFYVTKGPTQLRRVLDSPMLESAQERQFAISQLGLRSANFENEHTSRIDYALQIFCQHFIDHESNESFRPTSPYYEDLTDFRSALSYTEPTPSLPLSDLLEGLPSSPTPTVKSLRSVKSPMSVESLMNPEIIPPPPPERKRKHSDSLFAPIATDDSFEDFGFFDSPAHLKQNLEHARAATVVSGHAVRLRRRTRMRRSFLDRGHSKPKDTDIDRCEDD